MGGGTELGDRAVDEKIGLRKEVEVAAPKGEREGGDGSKAWKVNCEGAVVLLGELSPIHLGNDIGVVLLPPPCCCGGGARKNLLKIEPIYL